MSLELVQSCVNGDPQARRQLIEQLYSPFMAMARRYAKNNQQANALFHNAFIDVFHKLSTYKLDSEFDKWMKDAFLASIVQQLKANKAEYYVTTTTRVDEKRKVESELFHTGEDADVNALSAEEYIKVLQQLPPSFRAVYNMKIIDGYSIQHIAQVLEVSEDSARNTLERAKNQLAKNLQSLMHGYA